MREMEEQMTMIMGRLKEEQDGKKSYANTYWLDQSYEVGDRVFLRIRPQKISIRFGKGEKLSPRFVGLFEVLERKGSVTYMLALPLSLVHMHDVFHISVLRRYILDPSHVINFGHL